MAIRYRPLRGVGLKVGAQQADVDGVEVGIVAAADVGVGVGKLADHLAQNVGQAQAVGDIGQQLRVLVAFCCQLTPFIDGFEEVVALLPPDFVEDLLPFGARIHFHAHAVELKRAVAHIVQRFGRRTFGFFARHLGDR